MSTIFQYTLFKYAKKHNDANLYYNSRNKLRQIKYSLHKSQKNIQIRQFHSCFERNSFQKSQIYSNIFYDKNLIKTSTIACSYSTRLLPQSKEYQAHLIESHEKVTQEYQEPSVAVTHVNNINEATQRNSTKSEQKIAPLSAQKTLEISERTNNDKLVLNIQQTEQELNQNLKNALNISNNYEEAASLFNEAKSKGLTNLINQKTLSNFIFLLPPIYYIEIYQAYEVLSSHEYFIQRSDLEIDFYIHFCVILGQIQHNTLRLSNKKKKNKPSTQYQRQQQLKLNRMTYFDIADSIYRRLLLLNNGKNSKVKQELLSLFVLSMLQQNASSRARGRFVPVIYYSYLSYDIPTYEEDIFQESFVPHHTSSSTGTDMKIPLDICLSLLKYTYIKGMLPFADILQKLVQKGHRPESWLLMHMLETEYPYFNHRVTTTILDTIASLYSTSFTNSEINTQATETETSIDAQQNNSGTLTSQDYRIPLGILESISYAAAKFKDVALMLKLWDLCDLFQYKPTLVLYENAAMTYAKAHKRDEFLFMVLTEMQLQSYYIPDRFLIHSIAKCMRSKARVNNAFYLVTSSENEHIQLTLSILNCLLCAYAKNGCLDDAYKVYNIITSNGLAPNVDTYSFLLEAIVEDIFQNLLSHNDHQNQFQKDNSQSEEAVQSILDQININTHDISTIKDRFVFHQLVRFYSYTDREKAKEMLYEATHSEELSFESSSILKETFIALATQCSRHDEVDEAKRVLSWMNNNDNAEYYLNMMDKIHNH